MGNQIKNYLQSDLERIYLNKILGCKENYDLSIIISILCFARNRFL